MSKYQFLNCYHLLIKSASGLHFICKLFISTYLNYSISPLTYCCIYTKIIHAKFQPAGSLFVLDNIIHNENVDSGTTVASWMSDKEQNKVETEAAKLKKNLQQWIFCIERLRDGYFIVREEKCRSCMSIQKHNNNRLHEDFYSYCWLNAPTLIKNGSCNIKIKNNRNNFSDVYLFYTLLQNCTNFSFNCII